MAALDAEIVRAHEKLRSLPHGLAECTARAPAKRGGPAFRPRHLDRVDAVDIRALEIKQVPALVDDCDGRLPLELGSMLLGGSDNALNVVSSQAWFVAHWRSFLPRCRGRFARRG